MPRFLLQILFSLLVTFSFACNREKVNLEGRWEVARVSPHEGKLDANDSLDYILLHFTVGNQVDFTAGELTVHRKGTAEDIYYGLGNYKVHPEGNAIKITAGNHRPVGFRLKHSKDDQVEMHNKRQNVKVLLKPYEEEN